MKRLVQVCLGVCWLGASAEAQVARPAMPPVRSHSGQFIIYGSGQPAPSPRASGSAANKNLIRLEPTLLAVSCERIKQALLLELGAKDQWRGKVRLVLFSPRNPDETIVVTSSKFADGWTYGVELPEVVEPERLVRTMVRVMLLEFANRNAGERSAEIPLWLSEGVSQELLANRTVDLVVKLPEAGATGQPLGGIAREERKVNPLARVHENLRGRLPLTLEELTWPAEEELAGEPAERYRNSAQLFVHELLRLRDGRACLRALLAGLGSNLNWQIAFFRAFDAHFQRQLDLEKWWALQVVHFTGFGPAQQRSDTESSRELDAVLRTAVQVSVSTDTPPQHAEVSLQTIIQEWDYPHQRNTLQAKVRQLQMLRLRVSPPVLALADNYRQVLEAYVNEAAKSGFARTAKPVRPAFRRVVEQTLRQLDALDAKRETLRNSLGAEGPTKPN